MTPKTSRFPGFYALPLAERRLAVAAALGEDAQSLNDAFADGGLDATAADKSIENVVGTLSLPFSFGLNFVVNGRERLAPMAIEEPSVVAAASNAARIVREAGGFVAEADAPVMIGQVHLDEVRDDVAAEEAVFTHREELLALAARAVPGLVARGGGPIDLEVRRLGDGVVVVHVLIDCRDAMGANLINGACEAIAPRLAELTGGAVGLRILSNLCDRRRVRVRCRVPAENLAFDDYSGDSVASGIARASRFAEKDPYRATTHNKGIMNGIGAVVVATGNDWRAAEAGIHAFAARSGVYRPVCVWKKDGGDLVGELDVPLALGIVGGGTRTQRVVRLAIEATGAETATELAMLAGAVGMASNLAALRALATDGIQRGHMLLHARTVASAAGAIGDEVERVASEIHAAKTVSIGAAEEALAALRKRTG